MISWKTIRGIYGFVRNTMEWSELTKIKKFITILLESLMEINLSIVVQKTQMAIYMQEPADEEYLYTIKKMTPFIKYFIPVSPLKHLSRIIISC